MLIEVPLCDHLPGLDGTPSFCKVHVNLQLIKRRSPTGRNVLHRLCWGLKETGATLVNGRKVFNRNDAVVWVIRQLEERAERRVSSIGRLLGEMWKKVCWTHRQFADAIMFVARFLVVACQFDLLRHFVIVAIPLTTPWVRVMVPSLRQQPGMTRLNIDK